MRLTVWSRSVNICIYAYTKRVTGPLLGNLEPKAEGSGPEWGSKMGSPPGRCRLSVEAPDVLVISFLIIAGILLMVKWLLTEATVALSAHPLVMHKFLKTKALKEPT